MKLYYATGSCGLAPQIALREAGRPFDLVQVDFATKTTAEGDYFQVAPKGFVPALAVEGGEVITEGAVILQWIADQNTHSRLLPAVGTPERYRALEWLNYVATDMHKGYATLFSPFLDEASKQRFIEGNLSSRFSYLEQRLTGHDYLLPSGFSVADAYLYNVLTWSHRVKVDLSPYTAIRQFLARMEERPTVRTSLTLEGLPLGQSQ